MRLMAGLDRPTAGRVLVDGVDVTGLSVRKRSVAMVYQQFINYPTLHGLRQHRLAAAPAGHGRRPRSTGRCATPRSMLHIDHLLDRLPAELSGGQQQRLAIARALVKQARAAAARRAAGQSRLQAARGAAGRAARPVRAPADDGGLRHHRAARGADHGRRGHRHGRGPRAAERSHRRRSTTARARCGWPPSSATRR